VHPLAVHFCSIECKDEYMDRLFARSKRAALKQAKPEYERLQIIPSRRHPHASAGTKLHSHLSSTHACNAALAQRNSLNPISSTQ